MLGAEPAEHGILKMEQARARIEQLIRQYSLAVDLAAKVESITVGMQQRVEILKMLYRDNDILIFDEPTQGIDVGAKAEIYTLLEKLRQEGMSIILISSEIEEVQGMCNRTLVMREGRIAGEVTDNFLDSEAILNLMYRSENT